MFRVNKLLIIVSVLFIFVSCNGSSSSDSGKPVVTVLGDNPVTVQKGSDYTDQGADAYDTVDGILTVVKSGDVNTQEAGTYIIKYTAINSAGIVAFAERNIHVLTDSDYYTNWSKFTGSENVDEFYEKAIVTTDGTLFAVGGVKQKGDFFYSDTVSKHSLISKINHQNGDIFWSKSSDEYQANHFYSIDSGNNGKLVVAGSTLSNQLNTGTDALILSLDNDGNVLWRNEAGGSGNDLAVDAAIDHEGNTYAIVIRGKNDPDNFGDISLLKYNSVGKLIKTVELGDAPVNFIRYRIAFDSDNNLYISGRFDSSAIIKMTPDGSIIWTRALSDGLVDESIHGLITSNNFIFAVGQRKIDGIYFGFLTKIDSDRNTVFDTVYSYDLDDDFPKNSVFYDLGINSDGIITVVGSKEPFYAPPNSPDGLVVVFSDDGRQLYDYTYNTIGDFPPDYFSGIATHQNGSVSVVGTSAQFYTEFTADKINTDAWIKNIQIVH